MKKKFLVLLLAAIFISGCNLPRGTTTPPTNIPLAALPDTPSPVPPTAVPTQLICTDQACLDGASFDYLIVTRPLFIDALAGFINWKTAQGFRVGLATVDWLDKTFAGRHMAERMKTGMHALRKSAGVVYVLLVGDTSIEYGQFDVKYVLESYDLSEPWNVPTGFYRRIISDPAQDVLPSDAYFVEDKDWDPGNTGLNPIGDQEAGTGTFGADLYVGRWPVRSPKEIEPIVNKTKLAIPAARIFFTADKTLNDGTKSYCPGYPVPRGSEFDCYLDFLVTIRKYMFEDHTPWLVTESQFTDLTDPVQVQVFHDKFFSYDGIIVESYHGSPQCWMISGQNCVGINYREFTNIFPLLVTESCSISAFYSGFTPSMSESLIKTPIGPAVVAEPPNSYIFAKYLLEGKSVGEAFWRGAEVYVYIPNPISLFGDPSLIVLQTRP